MRFGITGSTGLIGMALAEHLAEQGHTVVRLHRGDAPAGEPRWDPAAGSIEAGALDGCDIVVALHGASIGEGRWNAKRKELLRASRVDAHRLLVDHLATLPSTPKAFISASAIGYYGDRGSEVLDERSPAGNGFLAGLVEDWEAETLRAAEHGMRAVALRNGIVLAKEGGALPRMLTPFRFGVGGRLGSGKQWMSWVSLLDTVRAIEFAATSELSGVANVTAPGAVTNAEFTKVLARQLHRPALFPVPGFALRVLIGEAANELLLSGQRVAPRALLEHGFRFEHPALDEALAAVLEGDVMHSAKAQEAD
jgi:hypothetical protein